MHILMITNFFPPANTVASQRVYGFAKYLPETGIDISVFTPERAGTFNVDTEHMNLIHPYKDTSALNQWSRKSHILKDTLKYTGLRPIYYYLWNPLYRGGKKLFDDRRMKDFDAVLVSFGPENVLRLGYFLQRRFGLPLILDFRDLWIGNLFFRPTPLDRVTVRLIESRIIRSASLITTVSKGLANDIERKYRVLPAVVYNGYFDDLKRDTRFRLAEGGNDGSIKVGYSGSLYNGAQPIELFFPVLSEDKRLILHIALFDESDCEYVRTLSEKWDVYDRMVVYKNLSNDDAVSLQNQCDILLFLNAVDGSGTGTLSGKLFEYMHAKKYILGIGNKRDEAAELIKELNLGDYTESSSGVSELIERWKTWKGPDRRRTVFYTRRNQVHALSAEIRKRIPVHD